jgi:peptidoglycan/LPS O-acetylase OafA/YrhL
MMEPFHYVVLTLAALALLLPAMRSLGGKFVRPPAPAGDTPSTWRGIKSLQQHMGQGDNLLLLRMIAATMVIYAHSHAVTPAKEGPDLLSRLFGTYTGSVAVYLFFFISGFLVTGSWLRQPSLGAFLWARIRRIVPAYAACLLVCAFVIGAAVTTMPLGDYFADPLVRRFVGWNLTFPESMQFALPGVFDNHPHHAVNGSLWTLPAEVRAYLLLAAFGLLGLLDRLPRLLLAVAIGFLLVTTLAFALPLIYVAEFVPMLGYFALGAIAWRARDGLPLHGAIAIALIVIAMLFRDGPNYPVAFALALSYGCLWLAYVPRRALAFNRFGDYSYGLYLWGFPMQQLTVHWLGEPSSMTVSLIAAPAALACAIVSWHLVEKPVLSLGRGRPRQAPPVAAEPAAA